MLKKIGITFTVIIILLASFAGYMYFTTPIPEYFNVVDTHMTLALHESARFVKDYYPDQSYLRFKCKCEDSSIAEVDKTKETVTALKSGTTKLKCTAGNKTLAEIIIEVK